MKKIESKIYVVAIRGKKKEDVAERAMFEVEPIEELLATLIDVSDLPHHYHCEGGNRSFSLWQLACGDKVLVLLPVGDCGSLSRLSDQYQIVREHLGEGLFTGRQKRCYGGQFWFQTIIVGEGITEWKAVFKADQNNCPNFEIPEPLLSGKTELLQVKEAFMGMSIQFNWSLELECNSRKVNERHGWHEP